MARDATTAELNEATDITTDITTDVTTVSTAEVGGTETPSEEQLNQCGEQTNYETNRELLQAYDVEKLLLRYGGPPGQIDFAGNETDPMDLPVFQSSIQSFYWFFATKAKESAAYNSSISDNATFVRVERAELHWPLDSPFPLSVNGSDEMNPSEPNGTPDETDEDIKDFIGELWWMPEDLCGYVRSAEYWFRNGTLGFFVQSRHCLWLHEDNEIKCFGPDAYNLNNPMFAFGVPGAVLASLVGRK